VGQGRIQYKASSGNDSFDFPLGWIEKAGSADSGKGFYLDITGVRRRRGGGKHYVFHAPAAAADLQVVLNAMPKQ
jgi:hypothetical protein